MSDIKKCSTCQQLKQLTEFNKNKAQKGGYCNECKKCCSMRKKQPKYKEYRKKYIRNHHFKTSYGITAEDRDLLLVKQNHKCAICGVDEANLKHKLRIDHDHTTGDVRELLCNSCNTGLGNYRDSIDLLSKAIQYLAKHRKTK